MSAPPHGLAGDFPHVSGHSMGYTLRPGERLVPFHLRITWGDSVPSSFTFQSLRR